MSLHSVSLDSLADTGNPIWKKIWQLLAEGLTSGVVQPLNYTCFGREQLEEAFSFVSTSKNTGKVLVEVSDNL